MKIGVCVKSVPETTAKIQVAPDGGGINEAGVKFVMSPYDEFAVEQAILLKEQDPSHEIIAFTFGGNKGQDALRSALAMGADRAVYIKDEQGAGRDGLVTAKVLHKALEKEGVEIVFTGRQAIDDDNAQVSQMLAEKRGSAHVTVVSSFEMDGTKAKVTRDIEGGAKEVWTAPLSSVFACSKGLNEPRYASLKGIMAAKKKPLDVVAPEDLGLSSDDIKPKVTLSNFELPSQERKNKIFEEATQENVEALIQSLRVEAKVI